MKTIFLFLNFVLFLSLNSHANNEPSKVPAKFLKIYIPDGFDDNDNVQVVVAGKFANSCFRYSDTIVHIDENSKTISLDVTAYEYSGMCLQVIMPFDHSVDLGILKQGVYTIVRSEDKMAMGKIHIRAATTSDADDMLYAPITQAYFNPDGLKNKVYLAGEFPLSCMKVKQIKYSLQSDVLVIQPVAEIDKNISCKEGKFAFTTAAEIRSMNPGPYLLHVRSSNGKSVNSIINAP